MGVREEMERAQRERAVNQGSRFGVIVAEMHARKEHFQRLANKNVDTTNWSLFLFPYDSPIRWTCRRIARSKRFDFFILALILANCLCLAIQRPYPRGDSEQQNDDIELADKVFVVCFCCEMAIKVIAHGFWWCGPTSYARDGWNVLDFCIVVVGVLSWGLDDSSFSGARVLRAFRVFRPLRLVANIDSLKIEIDALTRSIPQMINVALLFLFFLVLYAIIGLEMYRHPMSNMCFEESTDAWNQTTLTLVPGTACGTHQGHQCEEGQQCISTTHPRTEGMQSFNNAGTSILTVFVCTTLEGWVEVMYLTSDSNGAPELNWIYFVTLIIMGAFLITNLVLGVISANFTKQGEALLAEKREKKKKRDQKIANHVSNCGDWVDAGELPRGTSTLVEAYARAGDDNPPFELPEGLRLFDDTVREAVARTKKKAGWHTVLDDIDDVGSPLFGPEESDESGEEDAVALSLPQILVKIPGRSAPVRVGVTLHDTVANIRSRVRHHLADNMQDTAYTLQPDGTIAPNSAKVEDLNIVLRLNDELDDIDVLDDNVRYTLYKQSSLTFGTHAATVAKSKRFTQGVMLVVFFNTVLLGMEHYPQDAYWTEIFFWGEIVFLTFFCIEISFKLYAFGLHDFWAAKFNRVDVVVTLLAIVEFTLVNAADMPPIGISVWRCLRLLRVFRYTSYWDGMNDLANAQLDSMESVLSLLLLLFIFIAICALLGMQLFGGRFTFEDGKPRVNFDTFGSSLLAIFQVLTGEDWNVVMFNGIRAYGGIEQDGWISAIFFCLIVVLGNFTLLTVFLAIAMKALDDASGVAAQRAAFHEEWDAKRPGKRMGGGRSSTNDANVGAGGGGSAGRNLDFKYDPDKVNDEHPELNGLYYDTCMPPTHSVRRFIASIAFDFDRPGGPATRPVFEGFILCCIIASSVCLAVEDPVNEDAKINKDLEIVDYIFTAIFTVEMSIKIISLGLVFHPGSYLRDPWNVLDGFVVVISLLTYAVQAGSSIKVLRTLRVLRPLRMIKRAKGLQHVVNCLIVTVYTIGNVFVITMLLIFIFGVMGIQLFKGTFGACSDPSVRFQDDCHGTFLQYTPDHPEGVLAEREWSTADGNFNNLGLAMLTLFASSTTEGWVDVMFNGIDSTKPGEGPIEDNRPIMAAYFVIFVTVLTFFMINIFVGYVVMTFASEGEALYKESGLEKVSRQCIDFVLEANPVKKYQPVYRVQDSLIRVAESSLFRNAIVFVILLNTLQLLMQYQGMSEGYAEALDICNVVFLSAFIIECAVKLLAFNPTVYFADRWNILDFIIVFAGVLDLSSGGGAANIGFLRLFRVARVLKIVAKGKEMRALLFTFLTSFRSLPYVGMLIMLVFFIYAVLGMNLFADVELDDDTEINRHNNFREFGSALMVLFRCSTGEAWQAIMYSCWHGEGGTVAAVPFFVSFTILSSFLFLNLFVAVIMDNFEYLTNDASELGPQQLDDFVEAWSHYDPAGTRCIDHTDLPKLLRELQPPLGLGNKCPDRDVSMNLLKMNVPIARDGTVDFNATMLSIIRHRRGIKNNLARGWEIENAELKSIIQRFWPRADPDMLDRMLPDSNPHNYTVGLLHAVYLMQAMYRMNHRDTDKYGKWARSDLQAGSAGHNPADMLENPRLVKRVFSRGVTEA